MSSSISKSWTGTHLIRRLLKLARLLRQRAYRRGLCQGVAAAIEHVRFLEQQWFDTIVDVGANKGQFSMVARRFNPNATIHAFEPMPEAADCLTRIFTKDPGYHVYRYALGENSADQDLHLSRRRDSSSLLPIAQAQVTQFSGTEEVGTVTVEVKRLDEVISVPMAPVLLKLDVQGYELQVLRGAEKLLPSITAIYAECSWVELYEGQALIDEVASYLATHGFEQIAQYNLVTDRDGHPVQADILFTRAGA